MQIKSRNDIKSLAHGGGNNKSPSKTVKSTSIQQVNDTPESRNTYNQILSNKAKESTPKDYKSFMDNERNKQNKLMIFKKGYFSSLLGKQSMKTRQKISIEQEKQQKMQMNNSINTDVVKVSDFSHNVKQGRSYLQNSDVNNTPLQGKQGAHKSQLYDNPFNKFMNSTQVIKSSENQAKNRFINISMSSNDRTRNNQTMPISSIFQQLQQSNQGSMKSQINDILKKSKEKNKEFKSFSPVNKRSATPERVAQRMIEKSQKVNKSSNAIAESDFVPKIKNNTINKKRNLSQNSNSYNNQKIQSRQCQYNCQGIGSCDINHIRQIKPIFDPERYKAEQIARDQKYERASELKRQEEIDKKIQEDLESGMNKTSQTIKFINLEDFNAKYDAQITKWKQIKEQVAKNDEAKNHSFKPEINKISQILTTDLLPIEKRAEIVTQQKQQKIQKLEKELKQEFKPSLNKISIQLVNNINKRSFTPDYLSRQQSVERSEDSNSLKKNKLITTSFMSDKQNPFNKMLHQKPQLYQTEKQEQKLSSEALPNKINSSKNETTLTKNSYIIASQKQSLIFTKEIYAKRSNKNSKKTLEVNDQKQIQSQKIIPQKKQKASMSYQEQLKTLKIKNTSRQNQVQQNLNKYFSENEKKEKLKKLNEIIRFENQSKYKRIIPTQKEFEQNYLDASAYISNIFKTLEEQNKVMTRNVNKNDFDEENLKDAREFVNELIRNALREREIFMKDKILINQQNENSVSFRELSQFIDDESKVLLQNSSRKVLNNQERNNKVHEQEIIRKLVESNSITNKKGGGLIHISSKDIIEIEQNGLDSLSILRQVVGEYGYLFKSNKQTVAEKQFPGKNKSNPRKSISKNSKRNSVIQPFK